jgi:hypothetical protein
MLSGKEKRNQQAELTAVRSLLATHASAACAAQERCAAAEAQVPARLRGVGAMAFVA